MSTTVVDALVLAQVRIADAIGPSAEAGTFSSAWIAFSARIKLWAAIACVPMSRSVG